MPLGRGSWWRSHRGEIWKPSKFALFYPAILSNREQNSTISVKKRGLTFTTLPTWEFHGFSNFGLSETSIHRRPIRRSTVPLTGTIVPSSRKVNSTHDCGLQVFTPNHLSPAARMRNHWLCIRMDVWANSQVCLRIPKTAYVITVRSLNICSSFKNPFEQLERPPEKKRPLHQQRHIENYIFLTKLSFHLRYRTAWPTCCISKSFRKPHSGPYLPQYYELPVDVVVQPWIFHLSFHCAGHWRITAISELFKTGPTPRI